MEIVQAPNDQSKDMYLQFNPDIYSPERGDADAGRPAETTGEKEIEEIKKLLEDPNAKIKITTSAENRQNGVEPDIIIGADGVAHLNADKKGRSADGTIVIEVASERPVKEALQQADARQIATLRDMLSYWWMEHPWEFLPDEWWDYISGRNDLPPPRRPSGSRGGGFRGSDGGYAGSHGGRPGSIRNSIPREVPSGARVGRPTEAEERLAPQLRDSLDLRKFVDRVVAAVSGNEGSFTSINPNDAGYGISIGIRQWNQKAGELPTLLKAWHDADPQKFNSIFGDYAPKLLDEGWVRSANFHAQPGLMDGIKTALADKEFQDVQVQLAREFVVKGIELGMKYGFKSELGLALVVDIANQKGFGGAERALKAIGGAGSDEPSAIRRLEAAADRPGGERRLANLQKQFSSSDTALA